MNELKNKKYFKKMLARAKSSEYFYTRSPMYP